MSSDQSQTGITAVLIRRLEAGDRAALDGLIEHSVERLRHMAHKALAKRRHVARWHETGDVLQNALLRLTRALQAVTPDSPVGFFKLAATMIRRELIDLARHHYGPQGDAAHHASDPAGSPSEGGGSPLYETAAPEDDRLKQLELQEFHEQAQNLPQEERAVVDLLFYQGLSQEEAARLLGLSESSVKRRWRSARLLLHKALGTGEMGD